MRSNRPRLIRGQHIDWEYLWNISTLCQGMGRGSSSGEVEPWWIYSTVLTIDLTEDRKKMRHCSGSYEVGTDSSVVFLSSDLFLHESSVLLLLFDGVMLGAEGGFEDMTQFDLIGDMVFCV